MSGEKSFKVRVTVLREGRDAFFEQAWARWGSAGLLGVHEGTLLSDQAFERGLETESWTVDSAEAPRERDWVGGQTHTEAELYFADEASAQAAARDLGGQVLEVPMEDWDAKWKASYTGAVVPPFWRVLPPWSEVKPGPREVVIRLNPGAGFGTGTHETTQLCLEALGGLAVRGKRVLDFGSGSGILAIGAALLGASVVDGVEVDPLAIDNAEANAGLSDVSERIRFVRSFPGDGPYDVVLANILKPVLLEFAPELVRRLVPGGTMILSGLIASDVEAVSAKYGALLGQKPVVRELGEWRALVLENRASAP